MRSAARLATGVALALASCTIGDESEPASPRASTGGPATRPDAPPLESRVALAQMAPPFAVTSTAAAIDAWPRLVPGLTAHAVTSFDRSGGNDDGFAGSFADLYVDPKGEHVIFDERGSGVVRTLWLASRVSGDAPLDLGALRFYFDDEVTARVVVDADELFRGRGPAPFVPALVFDNTRSSGGYVSWAPLPFKKRLRITTERQAGFHQVHFDRLPPDWDITSLAPGQTDDALVTKLSGARADVPLEEVPLDTTKTGAGTIDVFRFEPTAPLDEATLRSARVRITFDGATTPHVDAPLGAFFGSGLGIAPVRSIAWTMTPEAYESRLPMPYFEGARIQISGTTGKLRLHVGAAREPRDATGYLETRFIDTPTTDTPPDVVLVDERGSGKLIATVLTVEPNDPQTKQWWEGDQRFLVDGARTPSIHGTGHEDDFLGGWSDQLFTRPFSLPLNGCPKTEILDTVVQTNARVTLYRFFPGVPFFAHLRHTTEHGSENNRRARYSALSFLYRQSRERLVATDAFDVDAPGSHGLQGIDATRERVESDFEGEGAGRFTATVARYRPQTNVRFTIAIEPNNAGVVLRRLFDANETPTEAELVVDDVVIGPLGGPRRYSSARRWATEDRFIPPQVTFGKRSLAVRINVTRAFNASRFEALTYRR